MTAGRVFLACLLALLLAVGASSTASAGAHYRFNVLPWCSHGSVIAYGTGSGSYSAYIAVYPTAATYPVFSTFYGGY